MPISSLSTGVISRIMVGEDVEKPVLQILGVKKITGGDTERLRLLISDGKYLNSYAMLATQLNHLYAEGELTEFTIIRVDKYITSVVNKSEAGKRVLIILELTVLNIGKEVARRIGDPVSYTEVGTASNTAAATKPPPTNNTKPQSSYNSNSSIVKMNNANMDVNMNQSLNSALTHPISSLSPYQNKWVIKVRVTAKSPIRSWSNARGEGKLFSMDLVDESGEIRATAFKEQCDKFYDIIEVGHVYYLSKCQLKPANKQYSTLNNDYEMTFTSETVMQLCDEEEGIPDITYNLMPISDIGKLEPKSVCDVIGVCKEIGELQAFTSKTNQKEFKKRDITLVDQSNAAVNLTLWGDDAVNFEGHVHPIILVKGARVNEFNGGKSLGLGNGGFKINPDIQEGHILRGWFDNGGGENITNISARTGITGGMTTEWCTFYEARERRLGSGDKPDYFQTKAVVVAIKSQNAFYKACPKENCNKKVVDENNGNYRCENCNAVYPEFKYRLLINMSIADWTSNRWVTCFNEVGEQLLKHPAKEIGEALETNISKAEEIFAQINFESFVFKLRSKMETYGDMERNKLTVVSAGPVNHKEYNKYLINSLKELTGIGKQ